MEFTPSKIWEEFKKGCDFKSAIGNKGLFEQGRINERFFIGDQWHGAKCGSDRPLVRYNVIKRIGDYKMSQILSNDLTVNFSADGIPVSRVDGSIVDYSVENSFGNEALGEEEINYAMSVFDNYYKVTAERVRLKELSERVVRNGYITGTSVLYTYWDNSVATGLYADRAKRYRYSGDICCEVLDINDIVFADPYTEEVQNQPYIIISSRQELEAVMREARINGADITALRCIEADSSEGKVTVLTKLYKEYKGNGSYSIKGIKVTENATVRSDFDTGLRLYPLAVFSWERKNNMIYGESEITYLIPNQIAINRMITANVWSAMTTGMPIMVVNGDTVTDKITNDPGQIIKVFGSNEDVAGAVKYISPPTAIKDFDSSINTLIENTMTQSGANEVALGDSRADNTSALLTMRDAALMPLQIIQNRFCNFLEDVARIWVDFWITHYGKRSLKILENGSIRYVPFDSSRYSELVICAAVDVGKAINYTEREKAEMLITLFEKGVIDRNQLLSRLPQGIVPDIKSLLNENNKEGV